MNRRLREELRDPEAIAAAVIGLLLVASVWPVLYIMMRLWEVVRW